MIMIICCNYINNIIYTAGVFGKNDRFCNRTTRLHIISVHDVIVIINNIILKTSTLITYNMIHKLKLCHNKIIIIIIIL